MGRIIEYSSEVEFLEKLKDFDICDNPYQSLAYYAVYFEFNKCARLRFFDVYDGANQLIGIVPMQCYKRIFGVELLRFVGHEHFNYEQYICRKEDTEFVHNTFMNYIRNRKKPVIIDYYDINNSTALYLLLEKESTKKTSIQLYGCPIVDFKEGSFDDFFKNAFKEAKKRTELKKFQKKLEGIGNLQMFNIKDAETYKEFEKYLPDMYRVFSERFADVYATSFFSSPSKRDFYDKLIRSLVEDKKGFISLLVLDDTLIAFIFCLANDNTLIDEIPAFDPAFSKYNIGTVQYKMLFEDIYKDKSFEYFDFSKGSTVYKKKWTKSITYNYQFIINFAPKNLIASMMYFNYRSFYHFKTWMRNNGVNKKIKNLIGYFQNKRKNNPSHKALVDIEEVTASNTGKVFNYSDIVNLPIHVRMEVLNQLYSGSAIEDVLFNNNKATIKISKQ